MTRQQRFYLPYLTTLLLLPALLFAAPEESPITEIVERVTLVDGVVELEAELNKLSVQALFEEGYRYDYGIGVERSKSRALDYYRAAAERQHPGAYYNLGSIYYNGEGVAVDEERADHYFKLALERYQTLADQGDADAQYALGELYYEGVIVEKSAEKSLQYYLKAAAKNHPKALNNLGVYYDNGYGVERDGEKALQYFKQAAERGNRVALYNVGETYLLGNESVAQDYQKARDYFDQAAEKNDRYALERLIEIYEKGLGVEADATLVTHYRDRLAALPQEDR